MRLKDQAICIRLIDWSETSQVVALLTQNHGKIRGLAKGSKRFSPGSIARYSGGIELLTLGQAVGIIRPSSELANLTEWDLQNPYQHLREDLHAQHVALYAADLINAMLADGDTHARCFHAMKSLLEALTDKDEREMALLRFQWRVLDDCGYQPQLHKDARTGESLAEQASYVFDAAAGGIVAGGAASDAASGPWKVRRETVELLREIEAEENSNAPSPTPGKGRGGEEGNQGEGKSNRTLTPALSQRERGEAAGRANRLLCVYVRTILDRELPTMGLILGSGSGAK